MKGAGPVVFLSVFENRTRESAVSAPPPLADFGCSFCVRYGGTDWVLRMSQSDSRELGSHLLFLQGPGGDRKSVV